MFALTYQHMPQYKQLMRVDRPIGTYLVAWPALWSLWIAAEGLPSLPLLLVFLLGAFLMRSAGCVINDFADRKIDGHVERTSQRPLATGSVSEREALQLFALLVGLAALLLLFTNKLTVLLAFGAVMLAGLYPFTKRYTHLPQVVLGMAFSWAIPMAFAAQSNSLPVLIVPLYLAVVAWVVAYDTFYAMVDRDDDVKIGVKSTAILFGHYDKLITALLQLTFIGLMLYVGLSISAGPFFYTGIAAALALCLYQQFIIRERDKAQCFNAFLNNNYVGAAIFIGIAANYL